jgi:hypothetical protein
MQIPQQYEGWDKNTGGREKVFEVRNGMEDITTH